MARWITVRAPFDYRWPGRTAVTAFAADDLGDHMVKDEVADFAIAKGYATEGKTDGSARSRKGGAKRVRSRPRKEPRTAADAGSVAPMGDANAADADRPADRSVVDSDAG